MSRKTIGAALALVLVAFTAGYFYGQGDRTSVTPPTVAGFLWPPPPPVEHFRLTDTDGAVFDESGLSERWTLVFFGYTHCPDICPTTMQTLKHVREHLAGHAVFERNGQVLFVSVDAERDTQEVLRAYTDYFNPEFLAASAPHEEMHQLTAQFGMQIMKISGDKPDEYYYDHPSAILLVGPDRRVAGVFVPPLDAEDIAHQVRAIVEWREATD